MNRSLALLPLAATLLAADPIKLQSPSGVVSLEFDLNSGRPTYAVSYRSMPAILASSLGLVLDGAARLDSNFRLVRHTTAEQRSTWRPVYGERSEYPDSYNSLTVELRETIPPGRTIFVDFRAYDEGVAFRYRLPAAPGAITVASEATQFRLPKGAFAWETPAAQQLYSRVLVEQMSSASERPLLLELPGQIWAAIAEAGVENYPSMFLAPIRSERQSLAAKLMGEARVQAPFAIPWRVVLLGSRPGDLLEHNYLLLNLSPASRLETTDWIRPGKVLREVTLSTRGGREAVDFAVRNGFRYVEYDAGWYGHEYNEESDATRVSVDPQRLSKEPEYQGLDLQQVIDYARSKGVGIFLYVNRRAMERQLDSILPLFARWGVAGVKYGFVNVHSQGWSEWLYDAVAKAAEHRLMLDVHDEFRPTGMSRAYPNLMTQEGILGNEGFPDATHSTILPFTRMLAGAADYTFCWLSPRLQNTWAHQLAMSVVIYSPLQFVYWYDRPVNLQPETPGMEWFRDVPTTWDDTKVVGGHPGQFAAIARRSGDRWYLGVVTNNEARETTVRLDMLDPNRRYTASVYTDGGNARDIRVETKSVRRGDVLTLPLKPRGGAAVVFRP